MQKLEALEIRLDRVEKDELDEMRNDLSNKFYVYDAMDQVEDYLVTSFREKCNKYFDKGGVSIIEWADMIKEYLPKERLDINILLLNKSIIFPLYER